MASKICLNCALSPLYIEILLYQIGTACVTLGRGILHFLRSCVDNTGAGNSSKWTTGQHHHMIGSVGEQAFNDKLGVFKYVQPIW